MADEETQEVRTEEIPWTKKHRKLLKAVPYIMILVLVVGVFFALRLGASRSMEEYTSFHTFDMCAVTYSDEEDGPTRIIVASDVSSYKEGAVDVPVIATKYVYTFKNKKAAQEFGEDLANEASDSVKIILLNKYLVVEPTERTGDDNYSKTYNNLVSRLKNNESFYKAIGAFGGKVLKGDK